MRTKAIALTTALLLASSGFLAGCGKSAESDKKSSSSPSSKVSESSSPAAETPKGTQIKGTGYSFTAPEGWEDIQKQMGSQFDAAVRAKDDGDSFADNINVIHMADSSATLDQIMDRVKPELESAKATNIEILDETEIGDVKAGHAHAEIKVPNTDVVSHADQYYIVHGGGHYVITFSSDKAFDDQKTESRTKGVLSTWKWTS